MFFFLFCFWGLSACRGGNSRHRHKGQDSSIVLKEVAPTADRTDWDTALLSLKTAKSVALENVLTQVWRFDITDQSPCTVNFWDSATNAGGHPELGLFPDHSTAINTPCGFRIGKWQLNKDTRELLLHWDLPGTGSQKDDRLRETKYIIRQIAMKQLELEWNGEHGPVNVRLSAEALVHKRPAEDPFYPANNQWRVRSPGPETHEQIRMRIKNCVHFYALFFQDNHQRQEEEISFTRLPSCFIWYNGGIGMQPRATLDKSWIDCFYSPDQAMTGYELIETELGKHQLKWPEHPTSWVKQTGEVLEQLAGKL